MTRPFLRPALVVTGLRRRDRIRLAVDGGHDEDEGQSEGRQRSAAHPDQRQRLGRRDLRQRSKKLSWKGTYSDLSGPATAAHFHGPGPSGKNAGVMVPIFQGDAAKSPFEGSATLNDAQAKALMDGEMYVNIHTAANKGGEIRGQVAK